MQLVTVNQNLAWWDLVKIKFMDIRVDKFC